MIGIVVGSCMPAVAACVTILGALGYVRVERREQLLRRFMWTLFVGYAVATAFMVIIYHDERNAMPNEAAIAMIVAVAAAGFALFLQVRYEQRQG